METGIAFSVGLLVFFVIDLFLDFILGDRGKDGQIKMHYIKLKGEKQITVQQQQLDNAGVIEEVGIKNHQKYQTIAIIVSVALFLSTMFIFGSLLVSIFLTCGGFFVPAILKKRDEDKRKELISLQFRDALNCIMSSLKSGLSMNSAIIKTPEDLEKIHEIYKDRVILEEFKKMKNDLMMGIPLEPVLNGFRDRLKFEEVSDFVNSIIILKKKGGNLVEVMSNTIEMIAGKMALKSEIKVLTAQKRSEAKLLTFMPLGLVAGMSLIMPKYMEPLFKTIPGQILAILAFCMLLVNYFIGKKITDIQA